MLESRVLCMVRGGA